MTDRKTLLPRPVHSRLLDDMPNLIHHIKARPAFWLINQKYAIHMNSLTKLTFYKRLL
jgi:hypothetical protein